MKTAIFFLTFFAFSFCCWAGPKEFVGSEKEVEVLLSREEGWSSQDLKKSPLSLRQDGKSKFISVSSDLECGTRTCTSYLFEETAQKRLKWIGKIDGVMEVRPTSHKNFFDILAVSSLGPEANEKVEVIYRFDGSVYRPSEEKPNER